MCIQQWKMNEKEGRGHLMHHYFPLSHGPFPSSFKHATLSTILKHIINPLISFLPPFYISLQNIITWKSYLYSKIYFHSILFPTLLTKVHSNKVRSDLHPSNISGDPFSLPLSSCPNIIFSDKSSLIPSAPPALLLLSVLIDDLMYYIFYLCIHHHHQYSH